MPFGANPELRVRVIALLGRNARGCIGPRVSSEPKGFEEKRHIVFSGQAVNHVAGPPIHRVPGGHQALVVLHEFPVSDDQFPVIPDLFYPVSKHGIGCRVVNSQEAPVFQNHPWAFGFITGRDGAGFPWPFNFHLGPDGDEIIQGQHGSGVGGSGRKS